MLYWNIGKIIIDNSRWGNKFVDNLARDIKIELPNIKGFSPRNLKYMKKFRETFTEYEFVQTVSAQLTWSHNKALLDKLTDLEQMNWYAIMSIKKGWSLSVLEHQMSINLYQRQVINSKTHNFDLALPLAQSELAILTMKDPYVFDFIEYNEELIEVEIEKELIKNVSHLLMELGAGFAFIGSQYHIQVAGQDFYIDVLFYNLILKCYFVIELKNGKFVPEFVGKMNFYLSAVDDLLKSDSDNPSIGLILCRDKNRMIAEYALKDMTKPIGVSEYIFMQELPLEFKTLLPSTEDIEKRIRINE